MWLNRPAPLGLCTLNAKHVVRLLPQNIRHTGYVWPDRSGDECNYEHARGEILCVEATQGYRDQYEPGFTAVGPGTGKEI